MPSRTVCFCKRDASDGQERALLWAASHDVIESARLSLDAGADIDSKAPMSTPVGHAGIGPPTSKPTKDRCDSFAKRAAVQPRRHRRLPDRARRRHRGQAPRTRWTSPAAPCKCDGFAQDDGAAAEESGKGHSTRRSLHGGVTSRPSATTLWAVSSEP